MPSTTNRRSVDVIFLVAAMVAVINLERPTRLVTRLFPSAPIQRWGDFNADYDPSHDGTCERSGSSFEHVIAFSSSDDIAFSLPPTLHH